MMWSIVEVARMAPVTSRTLRHYDAIGLLTPTEIGSGGRRYYGTEELHRLQQILLLRELGVDLATIGRVLDGNVDRIAALREHEERLLDEQHRIGRLARTVSRTIAQLEGRGTMTANEMFDGFTERRAALEADLVAKHGDGVREHFVTAAGRTAGWTEEDYLDSKQRGEALDARFVELLRAGDAPDSEPALALTAEHFAAISEFWTPDATSYRGLGQTYTDSPDFRARYDAIDPALAQYLRDALAAYADRHLS